MKLNLCFTDYENKEYKQLIDIPTESYLTTAIKKVNKTFPNFFKELIYSNFEYKSCDLKIALLFTNYPIQRIAEYYDSEFLYKFDNLLDFIQSDEFKPELMSNPFKMNIIIWVLNYYKANIVYSQLFAVKDYFISIE